ncbi:MULTISPECIES: AraC family transcriptional regulator [unclassified Myroides]|uniref:helix-turn-helix domain-containing protein n=1 Tax=unclassified Myroides TaxID=2642485 RepID=UPI002103FEB2|nr:MULTISPECIES: AraC family transcriptional regulator [unclassified Myroides]
MVCPRCIDLIRKELDNFGIAVKDVRLGEVTLFTPLLDVEINQIKVRFLELGFELLDDASGIMVEQIKRKIIEYVEAKDAQAMNLSDYVSSATTLGYARMARLFTKHTQLTIEKYYILYRIEKVKELISYGELSLEQIAQQLHYKEVSHMSKQFKKIVGLSPSVYRKNQRFERKYIDHIIT